MHLIWDWNGTLLDDLTVVVAATNASLAALGGPTVTAEEHRRDFRRPVCDYYASVLGRPVDQQEFARLDEAFHLAYNEAVATCPLAGGATEVLAGWAGTQSLLSMWFHDDLVRAVRRYGLAGYFVHVDGLRARVGGGPKAPHLAAHLDRIGVPAEDCVLIGDSVDDADAATALGARVVLYDGGFTDSARLRATGHPVTSTLADAVRVADRYAKPVP